MKIDFSWLDIKVEDYTSYLNKMKVALSLNLCLSLLTNIDQSFFFQ